VDAGGTPAPQDDFAAQADVLAAANPGIAWQYNYLGVTTASAPGESKPSDSWKGLAGLAGVLFGLGLLWSIRKWKSARIAALAFVLLGAGSAQAATVSEPSIGSLPPGKSTTITFSTTVAN